MKRILIMLLAWAGLSFAAYADSGAAPAADAKPAATQAIPFKTSETPLQEHGSRIGWVVIGLLLLAWGGSYYLSKKNPKIAKQLFQRSSDHLKILDKVRLNARTNLYVVEFEQKKVLIAQSGDRVSTLSESVLSSDHKGQEHV